MKKVAFIGGYDKSDLILYIGKILSVLKKKVLIIDTTQVAKIQYIVPTMTPTKKYVTTYDGIDIAIGFESLRDLKDYLCIGGEFDYDYVLIDLDSSNAYTKFELAAADVHFFVTSFDVYSVQRGVDVLRAITIPTQISKVIFTKNPESEENEYLDFVTFSYKVKWKEDIIYFPFDTEDFYTIFENQRFSKVRFSGLSSQYMDCMTYMVEILSGASKGEIRKAVKIIDRV